MKCAGTMRRFASFVRHGTFWSRTGPRTCTATTRAKSVWLAVAAAKTAAMRINLNIDGCGVVAPPVHSSLRAPLLLANLLAHNLPLPRAAH